VLVRARPRRPDTPPLKDLARSADKEVTRPLDMSARSLFLPAIAGTLRRLPARRVGLLALVLVVGNAVVGTAAGLADTAPSQWQPAGADLVRTLRPCPIAVDAPTPPVCWSMTEDTSAWMAQPPGSPYPWAQCTYYAGLMRPDIWDDRAPPAEDPLSDDWDAWTWAEHAQAEGLSVNGDPQPGDVMVWSRAAVGNSTGHVAIVDAVGGTDRSSGDLLVTVSEMNVEGLDNAAGGEGDTMALLLGRSELVPGMIQFIHRPQAGYTAPVWPAGSGDGSASSSPPSSDPSFAFSLFGRTVDTVSESTAPVQVTVTALPAGSVVKRLSVAANRGLALALPTGEYRVCVAQTATGSWGATDDCVTGAWQDPSASPTIRLAGLHRRGRRVTLEVVMAGGTGSPVSAQFQMTVVRTARRGRRAVIAGRVIQRRTWRLHPGRQALTVADPALAEPGPGVLNVSVAAAGPTRVVAQSSLPL
jgi:hypothetical protein